MKHVCHPLNEKHESCLVELYRMYSRFLVRLQRFTLSQISNPRLAYDKQAVGINKLNGILPSMCKEAGLILGLRVVIAFA